MVNDAGNSWRISISSVGLQEKHRGQFWISYLTQTWATIFTCVLWPRWLSIHDWKSFAYHFATDPVNVG